MGWQFARRNDPISFLLILYSSLNFSKTSTSIRVTASMRQPSVGAADLLLLIFIQVTRVVHAANAACYAPSGNSSSMDFWAPCPLSLGNDGFAMCCKTDAPFDYTCLANGLCQNNATNAGLGEFPSIVRGPCTDPSWKSPSCVQLCNSSVGKKHLFPHLRRMMSFYRPFC